MSALLIQIVGVSKLYACSWCFKIVLPGRLRPERQPLLPFKRRKQTLVHPSQARRHGELVRC